MKAATRYGVYAAVLYAIFLIATLPAAVVAGHFRDQLPGGVQLLDVSGSVWSGQARSLVVNGREFRRLEWYLQPTGLFAGRAQYAVKFDNGNSLADGVIGRSITGKLVLRDVTARLVPAEFAPLFNAEALGLSGVIEVALERLDVAGGWIAAADGTVRWKQAGAQAPRAVQLGDLNASFETTAEGVKGTIADGGGPLQGNGLLMLAPAGEYRFTGTLAARNPGDATLTQALRMMGNPGPDGKINMSFNGTLPRLAGVSGNDS
ncbi:MAG: proteinral secretion pathway protein N [Gammaproteobacteria bacterium]|nr:MAG: proteinral secretion pathway protein N [Gammaproteobacteria bacterium]TND02455.1 MAG: proteinral secretion pathway protein N [Gammaproteobacteria bacterium]